MEEKHFCSGGSREEIATWQRADPHDLDPTGARRRRRRNNFSLANKTTETRHIWDKPARVLQDAAQTTSIYCQSEPRKSFFSSDVPWVKHLWLQDALDL